MIKLDKLGLTSNGIEHLGQYSTWSGYVTPGRGVQDGGSSTDTCTAWAIANVQMLYKMCKCDLSMTSGNSPNKTAGEASKEKMQTAAADA